ncbi:DUF4350 domain-containing protein [Cryobacterium algoricola]|uniref:DUF4350 domain-containing protein n=1 Tax=Cryobacterium algoricola TaxID=1259183 RepID=A0ABY2ID32_9MICO|nr:DUF4350 domain-containing protein [Cryobacterium algoricola]TFB85805.1 DUF4350 domain-containing protein [Cryobacterium algoricola]
MTTLAGTDAVATTPTLRAAARRSRFWVLAGVGALLVAIAATLLAGAGSGGGTPLAADNAAPAGARALAEVLRQQGVHLTTAKTLDEARTLAAASADPTLFFTDPNGYLSNDQLSTLAGLAPRTVVVAPDFLLLQTLAPSVGFGGVADSFDGPGARCDLPAAIRAGGVAPGGKTLSLPADSAERGCFPSGRGSFAVVEVALPSTELTLVADDGIFSNEEITASGHAALALGLLGASADLIWYQPTLADVAVTGPPSLGELTPGWVTPSILLFAVVFLAAAVWQGRRLGPLVAENLPVIVRASETMEGRARLYARSNARLRALDSLRVATVQRLATRVGLSRLASLDDIVLAVSALTGRDPAEVRFVLVDGVPARDRDLIAQSDLLQDLERAVIDASGLPATAAASAAPPASPPATTTATDTPTAPGRMDL